MHTKQMDYIEVDDVVVGAYYCDTLHEVVIPRDSQCDLQLSDVDDNEKPRAWTSDEVAVILVDRVKRIAENWASKAKSVQEAAEGTAFSILAMLDGDNVAMPAFTITPEPAEEDKSFCIENSVNYFEKTPIQSTLHELYYRHQGDDTVKLIQKYNSDLKKLFEM